MKLRHKFAGVIVHQCAVGEIEGTVPFFVDTEQSGYSSLIRSTERNVASLEEIVVPMRRLETLIPATGIDTIKIDVEGAELGVLRGASAVLAESGPIVMFESAPVEADAAGVDRQGQAKAELWQFLADQNYCLVVPNRLAHNGDALSCDGFVDSHLYPRRTTNYFAVPCKRRIEFRDRARAILGTIV